MFTAKRARALSDCTDKILMAKAKDKSLEKLNKILPNILDRIEEAANRTDIAIYSINISNSEFHCINDTSVLQGMGYRVEKYGCWPWDGFVSW